MKTIYVIFELLFGIILFPAALLIESVKGTIAVYAAFHEGYKSCVQ